MNIYPIYLRRYILYTLLYIYIYYFASRKYTYKLNRYICLLYLFAYHAKARSNHRYFHSHRQRQVAISLASAFAYPPLSTSSQRDRCFPINVQQNQTLVLQGYPAELAISAILERPICHISFRCRSLACQ